MVGGASPSYRCIRRDLTAPQPGPQRLLLSPGLAQVCAGSFLPRSLCPLLALIGPTSCSSQLRRLTNNQTTFRCVGPDPSTISTPLLSCLVRALSSDRQMVSALVFLANCGNANVGFPGIGDAGLEYRLSQAAWPQGGNSRRNTGNAQLWIASRDWLGSARGVRQPLRGQMWAAASQKPREGSWLAEQRG